MTLILATFQNTLTRPTNPHDPTGISHAIDPTDTGNGLTTKASRAAAKLAWARYVQDYKQAILVGDSSGPAMFPDNGEIIYAND